MSYNRLYENLNLWDISTLDCAGEFEIPRILPEVLPDVATWIPFNYCKGVSDNSRVGIHMFLDDYQLVRLWNKPTQYIEQLKKAACICSPDFSMYTNTPKIMNMYNHYRKHWLAAWWQMQGLTVIPTVCWSDADSFAWCFDGEPEGGAVAVSSIGTQRNADKKAAFMLGYDAMLERLNPAQILFYGQIPKEARGNIIHVPPFYEQIAERRKNG